MPERCATDRSDLASNRRTQLLLWQLPTAALMTSLLLEDSRFKTTIWTASLTQMGVACLANASRCGRLHCFFTGPFFLLGALASLLRGMGTIRLAWSRIGVTMLAGGLILGYLPELIWGKYVNRGDPGC